MPVKESLDDGFSKAGFSVVFLHPLVQLINFILPLVLCCRVFAVEYMDGVLIFLATSRAVTVILPPPPQLLSTYSTVARRMLGEPSLSSKGCSPEGSSMTFPINQLPSLVPFII